MRLFLDILLCLDLEYLRLLLVPPLNCILSIMDPLALISVGEGDPEGVDMFNEESEDSETEFLACKLHMQ